MAIYPEIFDGPARNYTRDSAGRPKTTRKRYITVHATANDASARAEASYAKRRTDGTSSHYYADDHEVVQSLDTDWRAHHVGSREGNDAGISWEFTGDTRWSRATWLEKIDWERAAAQIARDCREHHIDVAHLTVDQLRAGTLTGFHTHNQARLAWGHTTHTDPGTGFPMDHLLNLVRRALDHDGGEDTMFVKHGDRGDRARAVAYLQRRIVRAGGDIGSNDDGSPLIDGDYGDLTARGLRQVLGYGDGRTYNDGEMDDLDARLRQVEGKPGPPGEPGEPGAPGRDGRTPTRVRLAQEADVISYDGDQV